MMRAKMVVQSVTEHTRPASGDVLSETVCFSAVSKSGSYPADGSDEDNSFARWTPSATLQMTISNPALFGRLKCGQKFYVDFTPAPA